VNPRTFISLETPRLILRRFRVSDLASFMAYRNDQEVARYQSWESISHAEATKFIAQQSRHRPGIPASGFNSPRKSEKAAHWPAIARCWLSERRRESEKSVYTFAQAYQHNGLACEAGREP